MLKVTVDVGLCQGARECVRSAPASFRTTEAVTAVPIEPVGDYEAALLDAARSCPNNAIRLFRDGIETDVYTSDGG